MNRDHRQRFFKTARSRVSLRQGRCDWYDIRQQADELAVIRIYDEIGYFGVTADNLADEISGLRVPEIEVRLDTPGGSAFDGITILNELRQHSAKITTKVYGMAASAGSVIMMAGEERVVLPGSMVMIHDAMGLSVGQAADMREMADLLDKLSANVARIYSETTGRGAPDDWRALMTPTDTWFDADEALEAGLATRIERDTDSDDNDDDLLIRSSWDLSIFDHAGRADAPAPDLSTLTRIQSRDPVPPPVPSDAPPASAAGGGTAAPSTTDRAEAKARFLSALTT